MKKLALILALLVPFIGMPQQFAHATVPHYLTYQGILKDSSGNFLTGTYSMVFKIYTVSSGGSNVWNETQSSVTVTSGRFSVQLGSVTALNLDFSADYWLGITVGTDAEMTPRVKLTSVGYAYTADNVVNGFTQTQHDALSHENIPAVRKNTNNISKTNFKLDSYTNAAANNMGTMYVDVFSDSSGINSGASTNYNYRGTPNYDVMAQSGGIDSNAVLLLHSNGTDASTTFTDSGAGASNPYTVTANGNAQLDTAQSKFGTASALFDGSGDYLSIADSNDWNFGSGDFTIDFWVRFNTTSGVDGFCGIRQGSSDYFGVSTNQTNDTTALIVRSGGAVVVEKTWSNTPYSTGAWYHIAIVRSGSTYYLFVDGTSKGTHTDSDSLPNFTTGWEIGRGTQTSADALEQLDGWVDEFRISKGVARWTSNFTPPSAEYSTSSSGTVISNTITQASAPSEVILTASETLNSGSITYSVSRDNGTTWTTATKETVTDISSQPSGTQLKWKADFTNDAELEAIALAV